MAIEIKELIVKFSVEESNSSVSRTTEAISSFQIKEIINQCTEEVLRKVSSKEER